MTDQLGDCSSKQEVVIWEPEYPCMRNIVWLRIMSYEQRRQVLLPDCFDLPYIQDREPAVSSERVTDVLERSPHQVQCMEKVSRR